MKSSGSPSTVRWNPSGHANVLAGSLFHRHGAPFGFLLDRSNHLDAIISNFMLLWRRAGGKLDSSGLSFGCGSRGDSLYRHVSGLVKGKSKNTQRD